MHIRTLTSALSVIVIALSQAPLMAHGGIYRGPEDIVPPGGGRGRPTTPGGGGGGGPTTGGPRGPSAPIPGMPGPTGPATGGPAGPAGARGAGGPVTRGAPLVSDLSTWKFWWEFNKHAYIGLRQAVHGSEVTTGQGDEFWLGLRKSQKNVLAPSNQQIHDDILPALKRAIDSTEQRDIVSSCMIAMAKIGEDHKDFALIDVFTPRLARNNQEIKETAALAMGISAVASEQALNTLIDLSLDTPAARKLSGGRVSNYTRSFALYGLGLYANEHSASTIKQRALTTMRTVLEDNSMRDRNLKVAAIQGIGMLAIDRADTASGPMLDEALDCLARYYERRSGVGEQLVQAHCPTAITKLVGRDHPRSDAFRQRFVEELAGKNKLRRSQDLARSCVMALGQMCSPYDNKQSKHAPCSQLLVDTFLNHKDGQTRYFSLLSLGQIGGAENRAFLLRILEKGSKNLERPWAAIALGVQSFAKYKQQAETGATVTPDVLVGEALAAQLQQSKSPELTGALGIALGLNRYTEAAADMRKRILNDMQKEEQAGYLCLGLALMRDRQSIEAIQTTMRHSERRTTLFVQAAIALGVLGDKSAADQLHEKLSDENNNLATLAAIAEALGQIGDRRSIQPLKAALFDTERGDLQRAFAAVSLGAVADRAMMPWHSKISANINYRAAVATLTNQQNGVLDIL
jgi:hypothetical protein